MATRPLGLKSPGPIATLIDLAEFRPEVFSVLGHVGIGGKGHSR